MILSHDDTLTIVARRVKFLAIDLLGEKKFARRGDYCVSVHYKNRGKIRKLVSQSDFFRYYAI